MSRERVRLRKGPSQCQSCPMKWLCYMACALVAGVLAACSDTDSSVRKDNGSSARPTSTAPRIDGLAAIDACAFSKAVGDLLDRRVEAELREDDHLSRGCVYGGDAEDQVVISIFKKPVSEVGWEEGLKRRVEASGNAKAAIVEGVGDVAVAVRSETPEVAAELYVRVETTLMFIKVDLPNRGQSEELGLATRLAHDIGL